MRARLPDSSLVRLYSAAKDKLHERGYGVEIGRDMFSITKHHAQDCLFWDNYHTIEEFLAAARILCHEGITITFKK